MTRAEMLHDIDVIKPESKCYVIDEMIEAIGCRISSLPLYHCELNPIELVWGDMKSYRYSKKK